MAMVGTDLVNLSETQWRDLDQRLAEMRNNGSQAAGDDLFDHEEVAGTGRPEGGGVTYYARRHHGDVPAVHDRQRRRRHP